MNATPRSHFARAALLPAALASALFAGCATPPPTVQQLTPVPGALAKSPDAPDLSAPLVRPEGYQLVWADEFSQPGLPDPAKWGYDTGMNRQGWYNRERQYYSGPRAENAEVRDGMLVITARKEALRAAPDWGGQSYTSARLLTAGKAAWTYGYVEARAKLPCGKGTWPAIWMLASEGEWPAMGELDIMELVGREPETVFSTVHTTSGSGAKGTGASTHLPTACHAFHTYSMLWTPQELRFGVDGKTHFVYRNAGQDKAQWPFDTPQFMILNIAVGGDFGGPVDDSIFPLRMEVDFVRVYQLSPDRTGR